MYKSTVCISETSNLKIKKSFQSHYLQQHQVQQNFTNKEDINKMNTVLTDREIQYHKDVKSLQTGFGA